jgi:PKD repeat protein
MERRLETILVGKTSAAGKARFIYVAEEGNRVSFTNQSLGNELSYFWDFNDTEVSKLKDPDHVYALAGYYNVCLTVTNKDGQRNTYCEKIFAGKETADQCLARFDYALSNDALKVYCRDRSFGMPDTWEWRFNEQDRSTNPNPDWSTTVPSYVKIRQTIRNSSNGCVDDAFALVNMGSESRLKAAFGYIIDEDNTKADTYPVDFIGVSLGDAGKLKWSFGDGTYDSTSINPVHIYQSPGDYQVCLTITNTETGEVDESCEWITVGSTSTRDLSTDQTGLNVFPNPFGDNTSVEVRLTGPSGVDLSLYDLTGRKIRTMVNEDLVAGSHTFTLEGRELGPGHYYLVLKTKNGMTRKIVTLMR